MKKIKKSAKSMNLQNSPLLLLLLSFTLAAISSIETRVAKPLGLSVTAAAEALGVSRKTLSAVLNGKAGISPEMAIRLSIAFDTSAESWLNQQSQYYLKKKNFQNMKKIL